MTDRTKTFSEEELFNKQDRLDELTDKATKTPEETEEIKTLRQEIRNGWGQRSSEIASEAKLAKYREEEAKRKLYEIEEENAKDKQVHTIPIIEEKEEVNGKVYFKNKTLQQMVDAGKITTEEAQAHAVERDEERLLKKIEERQGHQRQKEDFEKQRTEDWDRVKKEYPHFDKAHPKFDPDDPLYKEANELFLAGLYTNPKGLSLSIEKAKKILRTNETRPDVSDDLSVSVGGTPSYQKSELDSVKLSDYEEDSAVRQMTRGDVINPKTNKPYTRDEAIARALRAKKERIVLRGAAK